MASNDPAEANEVDRALYTYLQKRGYSKTLQSLQEDSPVRALNAHGSAAAHGDGSALLSHVTAVSNALDPEEVEKAYSELNRWIGSSLDQYRNELSTVMYPLFVHCYLDLIERGYTEDAKQFMATHGVEHEQHHKTEVQRLAGIQSQTHLQDNEVAQVFRKNKYAIRLCTYSFQLLFGFLQEPRHTHILRMINEHISIKETEGKPSQRIDAGNIFAESAAKVDNINKQRVLWGTISLVQPSEADDDASAKEAAASASGGAEQASKAKKDDVAQPDSSTAAASSQDPAAAKAKDGKAAADGQPSSSQTQAEAKDDAEKARKKKPVPAAGAASNSANAPELERIPLYPSRGEDRRMRELAMKQARECVALGTTGATPVLPSCCMYTFFNAENVNCITFSEDGTMAAAGMSDSSVCVWSLTDKKLMALFSAEKLSGVSVSADSKLDDYRDPATASQMKRMYGHSAPVTAISFSPDNLHIVTASFDKTVRLWSLVTFTNVVCYRGHNYPVWDVKFSPLGHYFASASHDRTARLWRTDQIYALRIFAGHLSDVDCVAFHPNSNYVATGSTDRSCRLWDCQTGECVRIFQGHKDAVHCLEFSHDGRFMASGADDCDVIVWDIAYGRKVKVLHGHMDIIYCLKFSRDDGVLASGGADNCVRLWDSRGILSAASENLATPMAEAEEEEEDEDLEASPELLKTWYTKSTPVYDVYFGFTNYMLGAGVFVPEKPAKK